jgi:hypothetical protein
MMNMEQVVETNTFSPNRKQLLNRITAALMTVFVCLAGPGHHRCRRTGTRLQGHRPLFASRQKVIINGQEPKWETPI